MVDMEGICGSLRHITISLQVLQDHHQHINTHEDVQKDISISTSYHACSVDLFQLRANTGVKVTWCDLTSDFGIPHRLVAFAKLVRGQQIKCPCPF